MILFIDTETSGKPKNNKAAVSDYNNWPRLVQISWTLYKNNGLVVESKSFIINPVDFTIPEESVMIHGISEIRAKKEGFLIDRVLDELEIDIDRCEILVGHNMDFDQKVIDSELIRSGRITIVEKKNLMCTMEGSTEYCGIPSANGYKWPTLTELHFKLFGEKFDNAHDAETDVRICAKCFWELIDRGILSHERIYTGPFATLFSTYARKGWKDVQILFLLMQPLLSNKDSNFNWQDARDKAAMKSPELFSEIEKLSKENSKIINQQYGSIVTDLALRGEENIVIQEITKLKNNINRDLEDFWSFSDSSDKYKNIVNEYLNLHLSSLVSLIIEYAKIEKYKKEFSDLSKDELTSKNKIDSDSKSSNCYIATFAYGGIDKKEVSLFRQYRDNILQKKCIGKIFIWIYYLISPELVRVAIRLPNSKYFSRRILDFLLRKVVIPILNKTSKKHSI